MWGPHKVLQRALGTKNCDKFLCAASKADHSGVARHLSNIGDRGDLSVTDKLIHATTLCGGSGITVALPGIEIPGWRENSIINRVGL
jgi:hypothetical protein